jgi:tetratricopeptide (TPR) repeat protein
MKSNYVILVSLFLTTASVFAQKDQIKAAENALKNGNAVEAKTFLVQAEPLLANATEAEKAQYNFVKGNTLFELATKNSDSDANYTAAAKAFKEVISIEKAMGKLKYSEPAAVSLQTIKGKFVNLAIEEGNNKNYSAAASKLYAAYELDVTDLEKLYYAANYAVNAKEYELALQYYQELKAKKFTGEGESFYAVNKENKNEELFNSKQERDIYVKGGSHEKPRDEKIPSKSPEIYKNIALLLIEKGKTEEAKAAIAEAISENPDDTNLLLSEADIYLKANDLATYKKKITAVLEKNPDNADLIFNLGVISYNNKELAQAEKFYVRVIEIDPKYSNAYLNLAILKLDAEKGLIDKMNKLGTSTVEMKKYDVLKKQRDDVFKSAIPYLIKVVELDENNIEASKTLLNVYNALEMTAEAKALKAKINK